MRRACQFLLTENIQLLQSPEKQAAKAVLTIGNGKICTRAKTSPRRAASFAGAGRQGLSLMKRLFGL
jgi:hypothetical protein